MIRARLIDTEGVTVANMVDGGGTYIYRRITPL